MLGQAIKAFSALRPSDLPLLQFMFGLSAASKAKNTASLFGANASMSLQNQAHAMAVCSFVSHPTNATATAGASGGGVSVSKEERSMRTIGVLVWLCTVYCPELLLKKFPVYLKLLLDSDEDSDDEGDGTSADRERERRTVAEEHVRKLHSAELTREQLLPSIPSSHRAIVPGGLSLVDLADNPVAEETLQQLRKSCDMLIEYLDSVEEDDEDDEEEEEED